MYALPVHCTDKILKKKVTANVFFTNQGYVHCNKSETIDFFFSPVHVHVGVQFKLSTFLTHHETNAFTMHFQSMN